MTPDSSRNVSPWGGRFTKDTARLMHRFNESLTVDAALIEEDIAASIAWAAALGRARVLTPAEVRRITAGLGRILRRHRAGKLRFSAADEDIHMAVERMLTEDIGDAGAKLHTGRSRNDQVATDFRLYIMKTMRGVMSGIHTLQKTLCMRARRETDIVAPGYTHLQQAQPVSLAHYWLSFFFALEREKKRAANAIRSADAMPLGAGALAGSGCRIDRRWLARRLGFSRCVENSMDAVASRDFVLEALAALCSIGVCLSRYAEDLIIWSSKEFGFIELDDAWSTGSSMMPQKKNPDALELIRGKCGRLIGTFTRCAATLKGVGLTYYKDLQEDKEPYIDSVRQVVMALEVLSGVVRTLNVNRGRIAAALDPMLFATDVADYLANKGVPFRKAHAIVGAMVRHCIDNHVPLNRMTLEQMRRFSPVFDRGVQKVFSWSAALAHRDIEGGTGPESVRRQLQQAQALMKKQPFFPSHAGR